MVCNSPINWLQLQFFGMKYEKKTGCELVLTGFSKKYY